MMAGRVAEWREFEKLIARIEADAAPLGFTVISPDRIPDVTTGRLREVDASIRGRVGTSNILITIECRRRSRKQDVTWIEQLAAKRTSVGADKTIAVSASGFSSDALAVARMHGITLRRLDEVSAEDLNPLFGLDFVLFTHKRCALARVGVRTFRGIEWRLPNPGDVDFVLDEKVDVLAPIFHNNETGFSWSINDLWHQLQEAADPFAGIAKGQPPIVKTACFPYPGVVSVDTAKGPVLLGDVLLSMALWLEVERVTLADALTVDYSPPDAKGVQRVEFASRLSEETWRISLQAPANATEVSDLKIGDVWPSTARSK